ncbi:MAG: MTAP family purine nucleoside phosphorylase [Planctomycetes bacterium]|nr:MTAP family purine nucleoside phosphorylase [Planctomycetota bacterium]
MSVTIACIAGEEIHRQWQAGRIEGERLGARRTPFGTTEEMFLVHAEDVSYYLLPRYGQHMAKTAPARINDRANIYALKDLGVEAVLAWAPAGAITHNMAVGDLVVLSDLIDLTHLRARTFFENSPLGYLRQFPVFCPRLRAAVGEALHEMKLLYHGSGIAAVCEGPRLETPAEIRMLATVGAEVVTHLFAPEVFLARELQLCYAAVCYVVNYAETGSKHPPFVPGSLFGPMSQKSQVERLAGVVQAMSEVVRRVGVALAGKQRTCQCAHSMAAFVRAYDLPEDWRQWFT